MSKADKMFEELGFEKIILGYDTGYPRIKFTRKPIRTPRWMKRDISIWLKNGVVTISGGFRENNDIEVSEHLAIHEKLKELGWLDD